MDLFVVLVLALVVGIAAVWADSSIRGGSDNHDDVRIPGKSEPAISVRPTTSPRTESPSDATQVDDMVNFRRSFSTALNHGVVEGWNAAGMRFSHALSTLASRAALQFTIAGGLAAVFVAFAGGHVVIALPWLPPPGLFWYVAAVGVPTSYFLIALALSTPRSEDLTVANGGSIEAIVRMLLRLHFEEHRERYGSERTRLLESALEETRISATADGRQAGYDTARREMEKAVEAAAAEAYERGRQVGEADKERAAEQAFERGFQLARN